MQDVKKVNIENKNNIKFKRDRRRKNNMTGYYILVIILSLMIAAVLSVTFAFNVHSININIGGSGTTEYSEEELLSSSGIVGGENLVRMNTEKIREKMLDELLCIDDVTVRKDFPNTVEITVIPSVPAAYVECRGGYMTVSENWRIIGQVTEPADEKLIVVKGFDPVTNEEESVMKSKDADKDEALKAILDEIASQKIENMVEIDLNDKYDIILNYDNRIKIKIEKPVDVEYKLQYAYKIITEELRENKSGYLIYRNSLGYSYVSDEEYRRVNGSINSMIPKRPELPGTEAAAGELPAEGELPDELNGENEDEEGETEVILTDVPPVEAEPQAGW
ncbi:MAG: FtsQ-type POTRA domain-containing protein [Oscillospiraceae bacterium]|nr:FtsQ-type POTRA domain-containing protein [Oscillospiraceae bacterium]